MLDIACFSCIIKRVMSKNIKFAAIMPHPPILVPQIGGKRLKEAEKSKNALEKVAKQLKSLEKEIDVLIIITPHGDVSTVSVPIYASHVYEGNFSQFGMPKPVFSFKGDPALAREIAKEAEKNGINSSLIMETILDHGILVPLYYPYSVGFKKPLVPIAISFMRLTDLYAFGKAMAKGVENSGKRVAIIASADMSHRLTPGAPSGFSPKGKEFDEKLVELVKANDVEGILNFDPVLAEEAGQDSLWSIAILLGALEGYGAVPEVLSYEGPFGVGYMVANYQLPIINKQTISNDQ
ncbi:MAG: class III extradiol dioxygenase subunit B-like domain-containing protein [Candidatus Saganbacteria bacterium]|nr:class III extradiol dioxygenase subunit B-like domain-containing protein [Candidatus Saganbacteria bacterium]